MLEQFLTQATIMVVSVTASTTQGVNLGQEDLGVVRSACDVALELTESKKQILDYVGARMAFAAPNLTAIVGASVAAEMMGAAGGLGNLVRNENTWMLEHLTTYLYYNLTVQIIFTLVQDARQSHPAAWSEASRVRRLLGEGERPCRRRQRPTHWLRLLLRLGATGAAGRLRIDL